MTANPRVESIRFDRHGNLWGTYGSGGVFRLRGVGWGGRALVAAGAGERLGAEHGLTSNLANPILEDREGGGARVMLVFHRGDNRGAAPLSEAAGALAEAAVHGA